MSVQKLINPSGGTDWSDYTIFTYERSNLLNTTATNVVSINGKGFLFKAIGCCYYGSTIKIYIDGVLKHYSNSISGSSIPIGIAQENTINDTGSATGMGVRIGTSNSIIAVVTVENYPYTTGSAGGGQIILLNNPIPFNTSLVVEYTNGSSSNAGTVGVQVCYK